VNCDRNDFDLEALALSIPPLISRLCKKNIRVLGGSALLTTKKESGRSRFPSCPERASLYDVGLFRIYISKALYPILTIYSVVKKIHL